MTKISMFQKVHLWGLFLVFVPLLVLPFNMYKEIFGTLVVASFITSIIFSAPFALSEGIKND